MNARKRDEVKPRLEADSSSIRWITPWGDCTAYIDSDGDLTMATSNTPYPVFSKKEWVAFCAAINNKIINKDK